MAFQETINGPESWGRIFQSIPVFAPLIRAIFRKHGLPLAGIGHCTPGTNAVFKTGNLIIKLFAPEESGFDGPGEYRAERFGLERANRLGLAVPGLFASGEIIDSYRFCYLVMEFVEGNSLSELFEKLSDVQKESIGRSLRRFTDRMDTPCELFTSHKLFGKAAEARWMNFSKEFRRERMACLSNAPAKPAVYIHGDLSGDNILVTDSGDIRIIDFADSMLAPIEAEIACLVIGAFRFDRAFLKGCFGEYDREALAEQILYGLLIHDFGWNLIRDCFREIGSIKNISTLRGMIREKL